MVRKGLLRWLMGGVLLTGLAVTAGCGCTSSYWESFLTLGVGCQYCGKNINGSRCLTPQGHNDKGCHCSNDSKCRGAKSTGKGCCSSGEERTDAVGQ